MSNVVKLEKPRQNKILWVRDLECQALTLSGKPCALHVEHEVKVGGIGEPLLLCDVHLSYLERRDKINLK